MLHQFRNLLMACFAIASLQLANAQASMDHLALSVKDPETSVTFYKEVFGMKEIENRTRKAGIRWMAIDENTELHLISGIPGKIKLNRAVHFAIKMEDFDAFLARVKQRGVSYSDWEGNPAEVTERADGIRQVYVQDPDGYWIEVNSAR